MTILPVLPIRIVWQWYGADTDLAGQAALQTYITTLMNDAVSYWASALSVVPVTGSLFYDASCAASWTDAAQTCGEVIAPAYQTCTADVSIPTSMVGTYVCPTSVGGADCYYESGGGCPSTHRYLERHTEANHGDVCRIVRGSTSGHQAPEGCTVSSSAPWSVATDGVSPCRAPIPTGTASADLVLFVMAKDTTSCANSPATVAYASSCATDQFDRPTFGRINFCKSALTTLDNPVITQGHLATAKHEMAHVLGFSANSWHQFRDSSHALRTPAQSASYTCGSQTMYTHSVANTIASFEERGSATVAQCPIAPIGYGGPGAACPFFFEILKSTSLQFHTQA
eukprot:g3677.t1